MYTKAILTKEELRSIFQAPFDMESWKQIVFYLFSNNQLKMRKEAEVLKANDAGTEGMYLGKFSTIDNNYEIGLFHYEIKNGSVIKKRVGLRKLVSSFINTNCGLFDAALVTFNSGDHWRFSFISDIKGVETHPKRYTYVFGDRQLRYKTPIERFQILANAGISFEALQNAFSVEALSDEFFNKYCAFYADFVQYITGTRYEKEGNKWIEKKKGNPHEMFARAFRSDAKRVRDYIKKMMGRITFLHFLQRKGWMTGDLNYMQHLFKTSSHKANYLEEVLEPLFFGILNTKPEEREQVFSRCNWDKSLLKEWLDIPYLNGGLFERDAEDVETCIFKESDFEKLFDFFEEYNFTVDENSPNDAEIGVDPEMLGKIFENLLEDNKDKGVFYTPKEIVQYMCRESLISYLSEDSCIEKTKMQKFVFSPDDEVHILNKQQRGRLLKSLKSVKICDPAIGSGAFPMGLLDELTRCRVALEGESVNRGELKRSIISNNIYGVDIEKGAVDIARLRFWLAIVVDESIPSPLPNLDYKIMQGNSLLESFNGVDLSELTYETKRKGNDLHAELWDDATTALQKSIAIYLCEYYSCSDHNKKIELQHKIENLICRQLETKCVNVDILTKLRELDLTSNTEFFLWHTWFSEVFSEDSDKSGFDIVIGNPPYVDSEIMKKGMANVREACKKVYVAAVGNWDMYVPFVELGMKLCNSKGIYSFIIPNKLLSAKYADALRHQMKAAHVIEIRDYSRLKIFSNANVYPCTIIGKHTPGKYVRFTIMQDKVNVSSSFLYDHKLFNSSLYWDPFYSGEEIVTMVNHMCKFPRLKSLGLHIGDGATVKEYYLYLDKMRDDKYLEDSFKVITSGIIEPYMDLWGVKYTNCKGKKMYPRIRKEDVKEINTKRYELALSHKIIIANMTKYIEALYDDGKCLPGKSTYVISSSDLRLLKCLLAILNSDLFRNLIGYLYRSLKMSGEAINLGRHEIEQLPIPKLPMKWMDEVILYVDRILNAKKENSNADISDDKAMLDGLVSKLYGVS